jgi:hypothetical protein
MRILDLLSTMKRRGPALLSGALLVIALLTMIVGCTQPDSTGIEGTRPSTELDTCAERMHELCQPLLLHFMTHGQLPADVEAMQALAPDTPLACPASGRPYVYNPQGLLYPRQAGAVVLYDAEPSHSGMRWAIKAEGLASTAPVLKVLLLPENEVFKKASPHGR